MCCGYCKTQPADESDFCPEDGVAQSSCCSHACVKKLFFKKWWVWTAAVISLNIIIAVVLILRKDK